MRVIFGLVLVIGVALAGFAVHITRGYVAAYQAELSRERSKQVPNIKTQNVYVTTKALRYGDQVKPGDVKLVAYPAASIPPGAYKSEQELFPEGKNQLRVALRAIEPMEALLSAKLTRPGEDAGVAARLNRGMRAFAIRVDVSTGVSGFLLPGDRVDVYWTGNLPGSDVDVTQLIEASVPLVAVDQIDDEERNSPTIARTVTVEATPSQVAALAQAQSTGRLSLALVGRNDDTITDAITVNQKDLLGIQDRVRVQRESCSVRMRKGSDIVDVPVPCPTQ